MKTLIQTIGTPLTISLLTIKLLSVWNGDLPPPRDEHGETGNQPPGEGVPNPGGIGILLAPGAVYVGKILYDLKNGVQASWQTMDK